MTIKETKIREYIFDEAFLKKVLKLEGNIEDIDLWAGLSPNEETNKVQHDKIRWRITTREVNDVSREDKTAGGIYE